MLSTFSCDSIFGAVVFDGDDTLWKTEHLYDDARTKARQIIVDAGIDGAEWEKLERRIDVQNVATFGFGLNRFPTSCVQAYEEICRQRVIHVDPSVSDKVWEAASSAFQLDAPVFDDALETLVTLRKRGFRLVLLTKGLPELQSRRIESSGLKSYFDVVRVVQEKTPEAIAEILSTLDVIPESAWMVGNSMRSDILPGLAAGMQVIWIKTHTWEYERAFDHIIDDRVIEAVSVAQVPRLILRKLE
jgi:putative hydrolase of the HAD superfamily